MLVSFQIICRRRLRLFRLHYVSTCPTTTYLGVWFEKNNNFVKHVSITKYSSCSPSIIEPPLMLFFQKWLLRFFDKLFFSVLKRWSYFFSIRLLFSYTIQEVIHRNTYKYNDVMDASWHSDDEVDWERRAFTQNLGPLLVEGRPLKAGLRAGFHRCVLLPQYGGKKDLPPPPTSKASPLRLLQYVRVWCQHIRFVVVVVLLVCMYIYLYTF